MTHSAPEIRFEELPESDYDQWDVFVDASVERSPFSKLAWLRAFRETSPRHSFSIVVSKNKSGKIAAGAALPMRAKPLSSDELVVPPLHPYNSLLLSPLATAEPDRIYTSRHSYTAALIGFLREKNYFTCRMIHHPRIDDVRPFIWDGWTTVPAYTFFVDLPTLNGASTFTHACRKQHRKCAEAGFRVTVSNRVGLGLGHFMNLINATYRRRGMEPLDYGLESIPAYVCLLDPLDALLYCEASTGDGRVVAARILVPANDGIVHDWVAGTDPEHLRSGVTTFLVAEILLELQRRGFRTFDFGGANTPGVADFKQGFNGALVLGFETFLGPTTLRNVLVQTAASQMHRARQLTRSLGKGKKS